MKTAAPIALWIIGAFAFAMLLRATDGLPLKQRWAIIGWMMLFSISNALRVWME